MAPQLAHSFKHLNAGSELLLNEIIYVVKTTPTSSTTCHLTICQCYCYFSNRKGWGGKKLVSMLKIVSSNVPRHVFLILNRQLTEKPCPVSLTSFANFTLTGSGYCQSSFSTVVITEEDITNEHYFFLTFKYFH